MPRSIAKPAVGLCAGLIALAVPPALADSIDGDWCREGRNIRIEGPNITTYAGSKVTGEYDRHGVRYIAPVNEPEAGVEITMVLRTEEMAYLLRRPKGVTDYGERERWQRCKVTS